MALLDHFHPPLKSRRHWQSFHATWATSIAAELNQGILPARFNAAPLARLAGGVEIDMATLEEESEVLRDETSGNGVAVAVWAPPRPALDFSVDFTDQDIFEVQIYEDDGSRLTAAIEIASPRNKDRPAARRAFAVKCASYLQAGLYVMVIDVVADRRSNLHESICEMLDGELPEMVWRSPTDLYVTAYRPIVAKDQKRLQVWLEPVTLGAALPTIPLWVTQSLVLPLELDKSYRAACSALRIPT